MESGLEDRNNIVLSVIKSGNDICLNGVRPRRPEQFPQQNAIHQHQLVSMESGLEDRNN